MESVIKIPAAKPRHKFRIRTLVAYLVLIALTVSFLFPYIWLVASSFKETSGIFSPHFSLLPFNESGKLHFVLSNYTDAISYLDLGNVFVNTMIVCISNTVLNLLLNALAAYAFARIPFKGREILFKIILLSMMVPGAVMMIPNLIIVRGLTIDNTLLALILPFVMSVYNIFLLRQQFYALSTEVEEAASIDGASRIQRFFIIALPLVTPMLVVLGITTFMWNYNNYLWPLVAANAPEVKTLAVSLGDLVVAGRDNVLYYPTMLAGSVIVSAPLIVIFFFLQRYIIGGISAGAVKG